MNHSQRNPFAATTILVLSVYLVVLASSIARSHESPPTTTVTSLMTTTNPPPTTMAHYNQLEQRTTTTSAYIESDPNNNNNNNNNNKAIDSPSKIQPAPQCTLGDDSFQIGERWNPNLPPFGVQVCVLCECTVRQRKSCYETKVTCRRITNECPVIDSCPDGSRPATIAGQCCKSCQSTQLPASVATSTPSGHLQSGGNLSADGYQQSTQMGQHSPTDQLSQRPIFGPPSTQAPPSPAIPDQAKISFMNERTKDYLLLTKNLPSCPSRDADRQQSWSQPTGGSSQNKISKGSNRNDLNGIDSRLAFKSLHDTGANYITTTTTTTIALRTRQGSPDSETTTINPIAGDRSSHNFEDYQHPNDVQSAARGSSSSDHHRVQNQNLNHHNHRHHNHNNNQENVDPQLSGASNQAKSANRNQQEPINQVQANQCQLGDDIYQVGDTWNPVLPPFGVQVCVRCSCSFRVRKGCYETRVACRRINQQCPSIDVCPDGSQPTTVPGQCCKSCPLSLEQQEQQQLAQVRYNNNIINNNHHNSTSMTSSHNNLNNPVRNEKIHRDFQTISKNLSVCPRRPGIDLNVSNGARNSNASTSRGRSGHR